MDQAELMKQVRAIQADDSLSDADKAQKRQQLLCGAWAKRLPQADSGGAGLLAWDRTDGQVG